MKDLYTFDSSKSLALATYEMVRKTYAALFDELKIPYLVAEADPGDMGGNLSHEFHFLTSKGEDRVISCQSCDYVANEELAKTAIPAYTEPQGGIKWSFIKPDQPIPSGNPLADKAFSVWRGLSQDRTTLVNVWYPLSPGTATGTARPEINTHAVKRIFPDLDSSVENAAALWKPEKHLTPGFRSDQTLGIPKIINLVDYRLPREVLEDMNSKEAEIPIWPESADKTVTEVTSSDIFKDPSTHENLDLLRIQKGDTCPKCGKGQLDVSVAIELGHTFFLGTRYSEPFNAAVTLPSGNSRADNGISSKSPQPSRQVLMQMGCHGIGVSRMIGAVAETLADEKGLNWPRVIAPYEAIVVPTLGNELDAVSIYDALAVIGPKNAGNTNQNSLDVVLDDRENPFPWKMKDADLIGYPVIVVVGKGWKTEKVCEVQCRRLGVRESVPLERLRAFVEGLLVRL
jgi:prolyl-tRNA synthetase